MLDEFEYYITSQVPGLTEEQIGYLRSVSVPRKLRKRHLVLHEGEVARYKIFVLRGLLRTYNIDPGGSEYTMRFTPEGKWTTDTDSFFNNVPSRYTIEALEPTDVVLWSKEDFDQMRLVIPGINTFSESLIGKSVGETQDRVLMSISGTAEEKYRYFLDTFPDVFSRVPLHMIASYLGVSRETLTRVRQGLAVAGKT